MKLLNTFIAFAFAQEGDRNKDPGTKKIKKLV